ncbi:MAG: type I-B CRISPR-associated protein Cas8b1/Cst1 [candidate division WOR-3 bacterium]
MKNKITLYPANWLYNAGVIGFLKASAYGLGERDIEKRLQPDGCVELDSSTVEFLFSDFVSRGNIERLKREKDKEWLSPKNAALKKLPKVSWWWLVLTEKMLIPESKEEKGEKAKGPKGKTKKTRAKNDKELIKNIWGKLFNSYYRGLFNANTHYLFRSSRRSKSLLEQFRNFVNRVMPEKGEYICSFCGKDFKKEDEGFFNKFCLFTSEQLKILGSSPSEFPNSFWNKNSQTILCPLCTYFLLHQHLGFIKDKKPREYAQLFINAHSFKIMWYLNKYLEEVVGKGYKELREILGMSLLECALKIKATLGVWSLSNIELVIKKRDTVDFYSLPVSVTRLLLNKDVASLLNEIGEMSILELVMQERFDELLAISHNLIKFQMKETLSKNDWDYLNRYFYLSKNKEKSKLSTTAYKLSQLYGAIRQVIKSEV